MKIAMVTLAALVLLASSLARPARAEDSPGSSGDAALEEAASETLDDAGETAESSSDEVLEESDRPRHSLEKLMQLEWERIRETLVEQLEKQSPPPPPARAFRVRNSVDVPLTLGAGTLFTTLFLTPHRQPTLGDQNVGLPKGFDELGVLEKNEDIAMVSDVILGGGLVAGLVVAGIDGHGSSQLWERSLLYFQALAMVGVVTELTKWAVRRPRPYTFTERDGEPDDDLSFFSGHTSFTAAWAFTTARSIDLDGELGLGARLGLYGGAAALTIAMGTMRVAAGKHWPTDVLVGGAVGAAVGWLVPELHHGDDVRLAVAPSPDGVMVALDTRW